MKSNFVFDKAKWIWLKEKKINHYAEFVTRFYFDGGQAKLYVSVKTDYVLYINDVFVDCGQYGDFPELKSVDEIDLTKYLIQGENKIFFLARSTNVDDFAHIKNGYGIIFEIQIDGKTVAFSDENVLSRESALYISGTDYEITPQIGFGYHCELNRENPNKFTLSDLEDCKAEFFLRPIKKLDFHPVHNAVVIAKGSYILGDGEDFSDKLYSAFLSRDVSADNTISKKSDSDGIYFIVDLKKERSGFLDFELDLSEDADIIVTFGEHLKDLRVRNKIIDRHFVLYHKGTAGKNKFTSYLRRIGCRYLQFFISAEKAVIKKATLIETLYPVEENKVNLCDFFLQSIWDVSLNTLRQCMHEHYEDCPWREQAQYGTDGFLQIISGLYAFKTQEFAKNSLLLMGHEVNENGLLCLTSPCRQELFIPSFSLSYVQAVCELFDRTKDEKFIKESAPTVEKIINTLISHIDGTGLIKRFDAWNFYEWTDELCHFEEESYHAPLNAMLYAAIDSWQKAVKKVKGMQIGIDCTLKDKIKNAIDKNFWDAGKGVYATYLVNGKQYHYAEYTQAILLWSGCCDTNKSRKIALTLKDANNRLIKLSLSNNYFKYEGLLRNNKKNLSFVINDIKEKWGKMLFDGATSFWETEEGEAAFDKAGSLCHGWSAIPIYFLGKYSIKNNKNFNINKETNNEKN